MGDRPQPLPKLKIGSRPGASPRANREINKHIPAAGTKELRRSFISRTQEKAEEPAAVSSKYFSEFSLPEELENALADAGFEHPTPIQELSLPFTLDGQDLIGCAQTGTGKTAAFVLPMITKLLAEKDSTALVLAPTRELAAQIQETLRQLTSHAKFLRHILIVGGASFSEQVRNIRQNPRIIVATPGRLVDHLQRKTLSLHTTSFFVLDEADRMFDMGFAPQLDKITKQLPRDRQTLLFSATFSKQVKSLASKSLRNPKEVFVGAPSRPAAGVDQEIVEVSNEKKFSLLLDELNIRQGSVLVFVGMKYKADRLAASMEEYGHSVDCIHGGRSMGQRKNALKGFKDQRTRILVATDIAARGLDIPHVAHVINYDLPKDPEDYIHRIGRTARAGALGCAVSFVTHEEKGSWQRIAKLLKPLS